MISSATISKKSLLVSISSCLPCKEGEQRSAGSFCQYAVSLKACSISVLLTHLGVYMLKLG